VSRTLSMESYQDLDRNAVDAPDPASMMLMAVALVGLGVTMIYSASQSVVGEPLTWQFWRNASLRQLLFVPPALLLMWLTSHIPYRFWGLWRRWYLSPTLWLLLITVGLVVLVLVGPASLRPPYATARRWFRVPGGFNIQPSELGKLAVVLVLAALLGDRRFEPITSEPAQGAGRQVLRFFVLALLIGAVVLPVVKEDFGTGFLIALVAGCLLLAGGTAIYRALMLVLVPVAGFLGLLYVWASPFRLARVETWLAAAPDPQGRGYHLHQALIAVASGNTDGHWLGRGLGEGIQKLSYLPEGTTDFIFSNLCEELGYVGGFVVIGGFIMLLWQLRRAIASAPDFTGQLIVLGVALTIGFQAAMNVAVVTGAIPTKGIALPFVSAGGSGLIVMSVALGIAASVARAAGRRPYSEA
jgi:cell division protein FtsW